MNRAERERRRRALAEGRITRGLPQTTHLSGRSSYPEFVDPENEWEDIAEMEMQNAREYGESNDDGDDNESDEETNMQELYDQYEQFWDQDAQSREWEEARVRSLDDAINRRDGIPPSKTKQLSTCEGRQLQGSECGICLECFSGNDRCLGPLGCGHSFHLPCLVQWFRRARTCPTCRFEVMDSSGNLHH
mmetsp:Transcript_13542/g.24387  ORF Transcript_13542/g.24387 Transcript_13542/m.24387 type:complete len:190 (-) Transcript_13542:294-863(-)